MPQRLARLVILLVALIALFGSAMPASAQTAPRITRIKIVLLAKASGTAESTTMIKWVETAPRTTMDLVLDMATPASKYIKEDPDGNAKQFDVQTQDMGAATNSGAYRKIKVTFPQTKAGVTYQVVLAGSSRVSVFPFPGKDGTAQFNWTFNPFPYPVEKYDVNFVGDNAPSSAYDRVKVVEGWDNNPANKWDSVAAIDSKTVFSDKPGKLAIQMIKNNAPANWSPLVAINVPAQYFGVSAPASTQNVPATTAPQQPAQTQPTTAPRVAPTAVPAQSGNSAGGSLFLILIIGAFLVALGIAFWYLFLRRPSPSRGVSYRDFTPTAREPELPARPAPAPRPTTVYQTPVVRRETTRRPAKRVMAKDLKPADYAVLKGASDYKVFIAALHELDADGLVTIVDTDPIRAKKHPRKIAAASLSKVQRAVIEAVGVDGSIDASKVDAVVAAVRARAELKISRKNADRDATIEYYEAVIRQQQAELSRRSNPTVVYRDNSDIWFWLYVTDHWNYHRHYDSGYYYPTPQNTGYTSVPGGTPSVPLANDDSFKQSVANFEESNPRTFADDITDAARRAADSITGAATPEPQTPREEAPRRHDACYTAPPPQHSDCYTAPHDDCVRHSDCVSHSDCVRHDACVSHSDCVHSDCVSHSDCVHSDCVSSASDN